MREKKVEFSKLITIHLIPDEDRINYDLRNNLYRKLKFKNEILKFSNIIIENVQLKLKLGKLMNPVRDVNAMLKISECDIIISKTLNLTQA